MTERSQPVAGVPKVEAGTPATGDRRRGRRPQGGDTRTEITKAARHEFAALGYRGASLRTIAARAGVDPHLIAHYFGSKRELFVAVTRLPFETEAVLEQLHAGGRPGVGRRLARFVEALSTAPESQETMTALVRAAASEKHAAALMREAVHLRLLTPLAHRLGSDHPELRAGLVASQIVGLITATHILGLESLGGAGPGEFVATPLAPVFEHYLRGTLSGPL